MSSDRLPVRPSALPTFTAAAGLLLALSATGAAAADAATPPDVAALQREIAAMRAEYAARLDALEQRLRAATGAAASAAAPATPAATTSATSATAAAPPAPAMAAATPTPAAAPAATGTAAGANAFNPAVSLILSGGYTRTTQDPAAYTVSGFRLPAGAEVGPGRRGFGLGESELGLAASIDPFWQGAANISLGDGGASVEEAWVQTTTLGQGLTLKAGRFLSGIGYLNGKHAHTWDFADAPLAYQALLGGQYGDDGLQARWLAPTDRFVELSAELARGRGFPAGDPGRNGAGMASLALHTGGDLGDSHSWRAGVSVLNARADGQALDAVAADGSTTSASFSGRTRVWVLDGVWKWAPGGNATRQNLTLQAEWLRSTRSGRLDDQPWNATSSGWYAQAAWQFMPGWRVGARTERLDPGRDEDAALLGGSGFRPSKQTLMLDFNASEFSRVRLQLARDNARQGATDRQITLQYQMSLGAHGAHAF